MNRFLRVLESVYRCPEALYGTGDRHERSFEKILTHNGILSLMPCYKSGYIRHPFGANRFPDFHLHLDRCLVSVELKSTRRTRCSIGDTWIKPDCLYIISYPLGSFISFGRDMIGQDEDDLYQKYYADLRIIRKKYKGGRKNHITLYPRSSVQYTMLEAEKEVNYKKAITCLEQMVSREDSV